MNVSALDSYPGCVRVEVNPTCFFHFSSMNVSALDSSPGCVRVEISPHFLFQFRVCMYV